MSNCPVCGEAAYVGFSKVECCNDKCRHFSVDFALEHVKGLRDGYLDAINQFAGTQDGYLGYNKRLVIVDPNEKRDEVPAMVTNESVVPLPRMRKYHGLLRTMNNMTQEEEEKQRLIADAIENDPNLAEEIARNMIEPLRTTLEYCDACGGDKKKCNCIAKAFAAVEEHDVKVTEAYILPDVLESIRNEIKALIHCGLCGTQRKLFDDDFKDGLCKRCGDFYHTTS